MHKPDRYTADGIYYVRIICSMCACFSCIGIVVVGHDSERMTETNEMQDTGYMRNFVTVKSARFSIVVEDVTG